MNTTLDFQARMVSVAKILAIGEYTTTATEAMKLIEQALRRMVSQYIDQVGDKVRSDVQEAVKKRVRGDGGIDKLTIGQMVYTLRDAKFLEEWARITGKSLSSLQMLDLEKLTQLRNKIMHDGAEATKTEAEFLLYGLKMILETFQLKGQYYLIYKRHGIFYKTLTSDLKATNTTFEDALDLPTLRARLRE